MTRVQSGPWDYDDAPPSFGERLTIEWLRWCLRALASLRCPPHPASRFPASLKLLESVHENHAQVEDPEIRLQLAEVQHATWELLVILVSAVNTPRKDSPFTASKLREICGGGFANDRSHARNTQFELYVPALFSLAGFPVAKGEPDSRVTLLDEEFGIEAKRINSLNADTLRGTIADAANQITGTSSSSLIDVVRSRGFIAMNVDVFFEEVDPLQTGDSLVEQFEKRLAIIDRQTRVLAHKTGVVGLMTCGHVARWRHMSDPPHWRLDTLFPMRWLALHGDDAADKQFAVRFQAPFGSAMRAALELRTRVPLALDPALIEPAP